MLSSLGSPSPIPSKMERCVGCSSTESAHRLVFCVLCSKEYCPQCTTSVFPSRDRVGICQHCSNIQRQQTEAITKSSELKGTPRRDFYQPSEKKGTGRGSLIRGTSSFFSDAGRGAKRQVPKSGITSLEIKCGRCEKVFPGPTLEYRVNMSEISIGGRVGAISGVEKTSAFFCNNCGLPICLECFPISFQGGLLYCRQCFPHLVRWKQEGLRQLVDEALLSELYTGEASATVSAEPAHLPSGAAPPTSKYRHLTNKKRIGKGGQAVVYKCENADHEIVVSKEMVFDDDDTFEAQRNQAERMKLLSHKHMIRYLDVISDSAKRSLHIILPYYPKGDLKQFIANHKGPVPVYNLLSLVLQLTTALVYLHHQHPPLVHGDVKPENVLLLNTDQVLLMDLDLCAEEDCTEASPLSGCSHGSSSRPSAGAYTCEYTAPEIRNSRPRTPKADIFSLGIVTYALAALPSEIFLEYKGSVRLLSDDVWEKDFSTLTRLVCHAIRTRCPSYPVELQTLIMDMLRFRPEDRPSSTEVEGRLSTMMMQLL